LVRSIADLPNPIHELNRLQLYVLEKLKKPELRDLWKHPHIQMETGITFGAHYPPRGWRWVGGIDWGFRNPFAAVWGVLDPDKVLWIIGERYVRNATLQDHIEALPRWVKWFADPSGATEIATMRRADFVIVPGHNAKQAGIAAVTARIRSGYLKVFAEACPNLIAEAELYRYPGQDEPGAGSEEPMDEHNHALGALRYLVSRVDFKMVRRFKGNGGAGQR
jgi:hypothetical protein